MNIFVAKKINTFINISIFLLINKKTKNNYNLTYLDNKINFYSTSGTGGLYSTRKSRKAIGKQDTIVITGCDTGLGYSLALHCHDHLNIQVIAGVHKPISEGAQALTKLGIDVHPLDITNNNSVKTFVQSCRKRIQTEDLSKLLLIKYI